MKEFKIVSDSFEVPEEIATDNFKLHLLGNDDAILEYEAYMSSIDHLKGVFDPNDQPWPTRDITLSFAWALSGYPVWEHYNRTSFHYGVFNLDKTRQLGRVSIEPPFNNSFDARIVLWVRKSEYDKGLDPVLFDFVKKWLREDWPMEKLAFPGREHDWESFAIPKFLDDSFEVPNNIVTPEFDLSLLAVDDMLEDYRACYVNSEHLFGVFGPDMKAWPTSEITLKMHLGDLGYCEWMHYHRRGFGYKANDVESGRQRGCLYVLPAIVVGYDCELLTFVTGEEYEAGFDDKFFNWAKAWVKDAWSFENIACPGREIDWETWRTMPEK